jgi:hypothetical protein
MHTTCLLFPPPRVYVIVIRLVVREMKHEEGWTDRHDLATVRSFFALCAKIGIHFRHSRVEALNDAGECKVVLVLQLSTTPWRRTGGVEIQLHTFLTSALDGCECRWIQNWTRDEAAGSPFLRSYLEHRDPEVIATGWEPSTVCQAVRRSPQRSVEHNTWAQHNALISCAHCNYNIICFGHCLANNTS